MARVLAWFKTHPLLGALFAVVGIFFIYLITRSGGGSSSSASASGPSEALQAKQLDVGVANSQISAGLQAAQIQASGQIQLAQIQASANVTEQANGIAAQLQLAAIQAETEKQNIQANATTAANQLQEQQNEKQLNAQVLTTQLTTQAQVLQANIDAAKEESLSRDNLFVNAQNLQAATQQLAIVSNAQVQQTAIVASRDTTLATIDYNEEIAHSVLSNPEFGHNYGGSATGVTQIVSALQGQGPAALASTNPGAYSSPLSSILNFGANILTGLF